MRGVLALALKRIALSRGTVPSGVPTGQSLEPGTNGTSGTHGTRGTRGTRGTVSAAFLDGEPIDPAALDERASLAADCVPARYLDAWALLQAQRPLCVTEEAWRLAIDDAGMFLDVWGARASILQWRAGELFDVPRGDRLGGLAWQLRGARVEALEADHARLADGRQFVRPAATALTSEGTPAP